MGMAANPNVYGVVAIGLGCEMNRMDGFIKELRARTDKPIEGLLIQEEGGTIETVAKAKKIARRMVIEASMCRREECDISELMLGIECGGSDATRLLNWAIPRQSSAAPANTAERVRHAEGKPYRTDRCLARLLDLYNTGGVPPRTVRF